MLKRFNDALDDLLESEDELCRKRTSNDLSAAIR